MKHVALDLAAFRQQLAKRWLEHGWISPEAAARLVDASAVAHAHKSLLVRAAQMLGTIVAAWAATGFVLALVAYDSDAGARGVMAAAAVGGFAVASLLLFEQARFCAGYDEGAWVFFVSAAAAFVGLEFDGSPHAERIVLGAIAVAALLPACLGYLLPAVAVWAAGTALLVDLLPLTWVAGIQLALLGALAGLRHDVGWHRTARQCGTLTVLGVLTIYLCTNPWVVFLFTAEPPRWWHDLGFPAPEYALVGAVAIPLAALALGAWTRSRAAFDAGLAGVVVSALSLPHAVLDVPLDEVMLVTGFGILGAALALRRVLDDTGAEPRAGLTDAPRVATIPLGWTREDIASNEAWITQTLRGLKSSSAVVTAEPAPRAARPAARRGD